MLSLRYFPRFGIIDRMEAHSTHTKMAVRGGGLSIFIAFCLTLLLFLDIPKHFIGVFIALSLIVCINFIDDMKNISRILRLTIEIIAAVVIVSSGVGMETITSPFGGYIDLTTGTFDFLGIEISPLADVITIFWMVAMMNVMNWMDGVDGLAGGVSAISSFVLFVLSLLPFVDQPDMALLAIILFGAIMGFLPFNFFVGSIKLGDTGSKFLGCILAITAILNQGKIATFFLVLGLPIFDFIWVIGRRLFIDKKSPMIGDTNHFHHRLIRAGFSKKQTTLIMWSISLVFGILALVLDNAFEKLLGLLGMMVVLFIFSWLVVQKDKEL